MTSDKNFCQLPPPVASTPPDPSSGTLTRRDADWSYTGAALTVDVKEPASDNFRLLELSALRSKSSVDEAHTEGGDQHTKVDSIFAVRGDGRVSMSGGGGVFLEEGNLEVSQGDATFKVKLFLSLKLHRDRSVRVSLFLVFGFDFFNISARARLLYVFLLFELSYPTPLQWVGHFKRYTYLFSTKKN